MQKIGYVVVREDIESALVQSQCIDVIEEMNRVSSDHRVTLVWFYRLDYLFKNNRKSMKAIRKELSLKGIDSIFLPFLALQLPVSWWLLPFVIMQLSVALLCIRVRYGIKRLHCRSYHAGVAALAYRCISDGRYVFDPRSPFPEENISAGRWQEKSTNFRIWKLLETKIINFSSGVVLVSPKLKTLYRDVLQTEDFFAAPNNYPASFDVEAPDKMALPKKNYTLGYIGSFGHWNKAESYVRLLKNLNEEGGSRTTMLFLVRGEAKEALYEMLRFYGVDDSLVEVDTVPQEQVFDAIRQCRFGVYLMDSPDPRLGVKTVEYMRAGLPIIVSNNILGAAEFVTTNNVGIVWDHTALGVKAINQFISADEGLREDMEFRCKRLAGEKMSPNAVAKKLISSYCLAFERT